MLKIMILDLNSKPVSYSLHLIYFAKLQATTNNYKSPIPMWKLTGENCRSMKT